MERRPKRIPRNPTGSLEKQAATAPFLSLPHIEELIGDGQITVGRIYPVGEVAVASDGHNNLAMLVRRRGETLAQLLTRLDHAIAKALNEDIYTDEVNPPRS